MDEELGWWRWWGDAFIHSNKAELEVEEGMVAVGLIDGGLSSGPEDEGLEGGVKNSSNGCNSSNFVKVTSTLMVGTTGIAT